MRFYVASGVSNAEKVNLAAAALTGLGVSVQRVGEDRIRVDLADADPADAVRTLVGADVAVRSVSRTTRLEDVFLRLVHGSDHREDTHREDTP